MDSKGDVRQFFWLAFRRPFGTNPDGVCLFRMHGPRCPSEADFCFLFICLVTNPFSQKVLALKKGKALFLLLCRMLVRCSENSKPVSYRMCFGMLLPEHS